MLAILLIGTALRLHGLESKGCQGDEQTWHARGARFAISALGPSAPGRVTLPELFWRTRCVDFSDSRQFADFQEHIATDLGRFPGWLDPVSTSYPFSIVQPSVHPGVPASLLIGLAYLTLADGASSWSLDAGSTVAVTRLPGVLFGLGVILLTYLIGCRLVGVWPALAAAAILAVEPIMVGQSALARLDMSAVFFQVLAVFLYLRARQDGRWVWGMAAGAAFSLGVVTNPYIVAAVPALIATRALSPRRTPGATPWWRRLRPDLTDLATVGAAVAGVVLFYPNVWPNPLGGLLWHLDLVLGTPHVHGRDFLNTSAWFHFLRSPQHVLPTTLLLAALGLAVGLRHDRPRALLLATWFLGGLILLSVVPGRKFTRNFLELLPCLSLLAGVGLTWLTARIGQVRARRIPRAAVFALTAGLVGSAGIASTLYWQPYPQLYTWPWIGSPQSMRVMDVVSESEGVKEAVSYIRAKGGPGARIALYTGVAQAAYYHPRRLLTMAGSPADLRGQDWLVVLPKYAIAAPGDVPLVALARRMRPTVVISLHQIELARVYRLRPGFRE